MPILIVWKEIDQRIFFSIFDSQTNSWRPVAPVPGANTNLIPSAERLFIDELH
ncbi:MAG TPA: hypothetical protein VF233_08765 [Nitrososphaeraceae archaeon]